MLEDEDVYVIEHIPFIEDSPKDICVDGTPYTGERDQISKWASAVALNNFKVGDEVTEEEMEKALRMAMAQQTLDSLCEKGMIESYMENDEMLYRATEKGKNYPL